MKFALVDCRFALASIVLGVGGVLGLAMAPFPMDPVGSPSTTLGMLHLGIAALLSLSSMATLLLFGLGWRSRADSSKLSTYSFARLLIVFVSGALAAAAAAGGWPTVGLFERVTRMFAVAVVLLRTNLNHP